MRVTTVFNRLLALPGANVLAVSFLDDAVLVQVRARSRRLHCPCGFSCRASYDQSQRRWRHLDLGGHKVWLVGTIRRLRCRRCQRVRTEQVPWARPGARHTRAFENTAAWLAKRTDRKAVSQLLRCSWQAVSDIVGRVVAEHLHDSRLDGLRHLGVDEIGYRRGHQYLTVVADHDTGRVVWVGKGKDGAQLQAFFDLLGPERLAKIEAISMDMGQAYLAAAQRSVPDAAICLDAFHLVQWANQALEAVLRETATGLPARQLRKQRYLLRAGKEKLTDQRRAELNKLRRDQHALGRAYDLKEALRDLFRQVPPDDAERYLRAWVRKARRSRIIPFVNLATRVEHHFHGFINTVHKGLSNSRLEGINGKIRLINARAYGHHSVDALRNAIYLNLGGIDIPLPTGS